MMKEDSRQRNKEDATSRREEEKVREAADEEEEQEEGDEEEGEGKQYDALSAALLDNLKTGRRIYYLIAIVAIFLLVVLLENDPARVPVLQRALATCREYQARQVKLKDTWTNLVEIARAGDQEIADWYNDFQRPRAASTAAWLELTLEADSKEIGERNLEGNVFLLWHYLDQLRPQNASSGLSIDTELGSSSVEIPTDQPTLSVRAAYLKILAGLAAAILRDANLTLTVTASAGAPETYKIERTPAGNMQSDDNSKDKISKRLQECLLFQKVAFLVNEEKYKIEYFMELERSFVAVKASLDDLQMWESVTRVRYNPSLTYRGSVYGKVEVRDDSFFNDAALNRTIADLRTEMESAGKKLRIPMTNYEARSDTTVILTGLILVALYIAYCLTLENIARLVTRTRTQTIRFFPWAILWGVMRLRTTELGVRTVRRIVNVATIIHCYLGAFLIGWSTVRMLQLRTSPALEISIAGICCCASATIGTLCTFRINKIQHAFAKN